MSEQSEGAIQPAGTAPRPEPVVRAITITDINEAWAQGIRDFWTVPTYGLVFGGFYAAGGIVIVLSVTALGLGYLASFLSVQDVDGAERHRTLKAAKSAAQKHEDEFCAAVDDELMDAVGG
jgi:hypothetical protein